jgi:hypothetical protein
MSFVQEKARCRILVGGSMTKLQRQIKKLKFYVLACSIPRQLRLVLPCSVLLAFGALNRSTNIVLAFAISINQYFIEERVWLP